MWLANREDPGIVSLALMCNSDPAQQTLVHQIPPTHSTHQPQEIPRIKPIQLSNRTIQQEPNPYNQTTGATCLELASRTRPLEPKP